MTARQIALLALAIGGIALVSPPGFGLLRMGGWVSMVWVLGLWSLLVLAAYLASRVQGPPGEGDPEP